MENASEGWVRPNLWRGFRSDPVTASSSATGFVPFQADLGGNWAEINAGVSATVNKTSALYANASPQTGRQKLRLQRQGSESK